MRTLLLLLSFLFTIPLFINKDVFVNEPYNNTEQFNQQLSSLQTIEQLANYIDSIAVTFSVSSLSPEYGIIVENVVSNRFYHGFSHYRLNENWIAVVGEKLTGIGFASKVEPAAIVKHPHAACSQQAIVMMELLKRKNIPYRKVCFPHHFALEAKFNGQWYYFDTDMEPVISVEDRKHTHWMGNNDLLKQFYNKKYYNVDYQLGNHKKAIIGRENENIAANQKVFNKVAFTASRFIWLLPFLGWVWLTLRKRKNKNNERKHHK